MEKSASFSWSRLSDGFRRDASRRDTRPVTSADGEEVAGPKTQAVPGQRGHLAPQKRRQQNPPPVPPCDGDVRSAEKPSHESVLRTVPGALSGEL